MTHLRTVRCYLITTIPALCQTRSPSLLSADLLETPWAVTETSSESRCDSYSCPSVGIQSYLAPVGFILAS